MTDQDEWSVNATEALAISLVRGEKDGLKTVAQFNPRFTYPIFGDEEQIFGYKGLQINLRYHADDMRPNLQIAYSKKFKAVGETEPTDVKEVLQNHLPPVAFQSAKDFESTLKKNEPFQPPAELHQAFTTPDGDFEIRRGSLTDLAIQQLIHRIEILVPLFIEGGSYIAQNPDENGHPTLQAPEDADRWTVFLLYKKLANLDDDSHSDYTFVGYSTVYRFFPFQQPTPPASPRSDWDIPQGEFDLFDLPCRTRLSQFIILPPFQGKGMGARLYKSIFQHFFKSSQTIEFTVEDPNEAFDDMRDLSDLTFLRTLPEFSQVKVNTGVVLPKDKASAVPREIIDPAMLDKLRRQTKIAPRQFARLIEMHTMSQLPELVQPSFQPKKGSPTPANKYQYHLWQLFVKRRLYRQNRDILSQIEASERSEKLNEALGSVELEYARLLADHARWAKHYELSAEEHGTKRKSAPGAEQQATSKRVRIEDA